mgnify:CR=1 FL=1
MLPMWLMIAQGVKQLADNQNEQTNNTQSNQPVNNNNAGNAFSTISSIYNNYLDNNKDKKKNWFSQIFGNR